MKLLHRKTVSSRASPLRVVTDLVFAMTLLVILIVALLAGLAGVMYWTKMDLGIDLFNNHLLDFF